MQDLEADDLPWFESGLNKNDGYFLLVMFLTIVVPCTVLYFAIKRSSFIT